MTTEHLPTVTTYAIRRESDRICRLVKYSTTAIWQLRVNILDQLFAADYEDVNADLRVHHIRGALADVDLLTDMIMVHMIKNNL